MNLKQFATAGSVLVILHAVMATEVPAEAVEARASDVDVEAREPFFFLAPLAARIGMGIGRKVIGKVAGKAARKGASQGAQNHHQNRQNRKRKRSFEDDDVLSARDILELEDEAVLIARETFVDFFEERGLGSGEDLEDLFERALEDYDELD
ncbi:hypothetical protein FA15DRAFT_697761 [Coprinopsis marcescibilis]|uniref:Uncharacterized protein n=1 Tax=Coprinopsis marcescibilis TaxID=230819 RepID=A0A5C3KG15_COPMA|nr:hypothetical protein FA15DRAFT_697761 [Coprinopsis marcescibilis]